MARTNRMQALIDGTFGAGMFDFVGFDPNGAIIIAPHDVAEDMTEDDWREWCDDNGEPYHAAFLPCECDECREGIQA